MRVSIEIDIEDAYSNLYAREQAEFIEEPNFFDDFRHSDYEQESVE